MNLADVISACDDERCREALVKICAGFATDEDWRYVVTPKFTSTDYIVSDKGRVVSLPRYREYEPGPRSQVKHRKFLPGGLLKPGTQPSGHQTLLLTHHKKPYSTHVHRLVAWAFLGLQPAGLHVRHLDGNPANNHLENLQFVMPWENGTAFTDPSGYQGTSVVVGASLERRILTASEGHGDPIPVLREILVLLKRSRNNLKPGI